MMKNFSFLLAAAVGLALSSNIASAALVVNAMQTNASQTAFAGGVLDNDLINDGQSTLAGVSIVGYNPVGASGPVGVLNDGLHGPALAGTDPSALIDGDDIFTVTYDLNVSGTGSPDGYDLLSIRSYAAFGSASRTGQNYEVLVDFVDDALGFVSLGSFDIASGNLASRLTLGNDVNFGVDAFATNVGAIQFISSVSPSNDTVWREIDVVGVASSSTVIPEPSSLALFFLGTGIAATRRRRKRS